MKRSLVLWGERYLYHPTLMQKILSILVLPLSFIYCLIVYIKYLRSKPKNFGIPIVSVGNLTVGGSGKTPLVIELAKHFRRPAVVLRGYGRQSSGMVVIKDREILADITQSGDEAMLYATTLEHAVVIVSEKRERAIAEALSMGCDMVFLDDGYSKHSILKLDLLIDVITPNTFCLPSGPYREKLWSGKKAIVVREGEVFVRKVNISNPSDSMVLVSAIARPQRLDPFIPEGIEKVYFEDHHRFSLHELEEIKRTHNATSLLVTRKDFVKMSSFKQFNFSILELELDIDKSLIAIVKEYVDAKKD